jgi:mono/diheme cytochrome c family protein
MKTPGFAFLAAATAIFAAAAPALAAPDGAALFAGNCSACHQAAGEGIPGAFPALANNKFVVGDPKLVAATVLNGRGGMPAFRDSLKDDELAAAVSYVRMNWGNKAVAIPAATFAAVRTGAAKVDRPMPVH